MSGMPISGNRPVQYIPGQTSLPQNTSPVQSQNNLSGEYKYPYNEDVFQGQYQSFKQMYTNFDTDISKYSPFFGRGGQVSAQGIQSSPSSLGSPQSSNGIPASLQGQNSNRPAIDISQVPQGNNNVATTPVTTQQQVPTTLQQKPSTPAKNIPSGPVINGIQQQLQDEASKINSPQKAVEVIAGHAMISRQERTMVSNIAWGARYYSKQALSMTENLAKNKANMSPTQIQAQIRNIESLKIKSVSLLNDAKKKAISTYNEALKSTLLYNNYFTGNGAYASMLSPNDRQFVESEIDKTWKNWQGGFEKEWNGQMVHANEAPELIDKSAREVALDLDKTEKLLATLK